LWRLAAAVVVTAAVATAIVITAAAEQNDKNDNNPSAPATTKTTKTIVTHNCLPPFGLQYIILHRHKTCYSFLLAYKKSIIIIFLV
jgi:hypothetical protein